MMKEVICYNEDPAPLGRDRLSAVECCDYIPAGWLGAIGDADICRTWVPAADMAETDAHYRITLEAPGLDTKSLDIRFQDGMLRVRGTKEKESEEGECCHCSERFNGAFERHFSIPGAVDADRIDAVYKDGILKLTLPKTEQARARKIEVH